MFKKFRRTIESDENNTTQQAQISLHTYVSEHDDVAQEDESVAQEDESVAQEDESVAQEDESVAQEDESVGQEDESESAQKEFQKGGLDGNAEEEDMVITDLGALSKPKKKLFSKPKKKLLSKAKKKLPDNPQVKKAPQARPKPNDEYSHIMYAQSFARELCDAFDQKNASPDIDSDSDEDIQAAGADGVLYSGPASDVNEDFILQLDLVIESEITTSRGRQIQATNEYYRKLYDGFIAKQRQIDFMISNPSIALQHFGLIVNADTSHYRCM